MGEEKTREQLVGNILSECPFVGNHLVEFHLKKRLENPKLCWKLWSKYKEKF